MASVLGEGEEGDMVKGGRQEGHYGKHWSFLVEYIRYKLLQSNYGSQNSDHSLAISSTEHMKPYE